ncbi:MAG: endonuclease domain-containing protein [Bacteroidales bacterium]
MDWKRNYEWNMYYGADSITRRRAKNLRSNLTKAELCLWENIRDRKLGFKFRRQHPIGIYIVDFYCHELKLVVEVDGDIHQEHEQIDWDRERTIKLNMLKIKVIRFTNDEVLNNIDEVINSIQEKIYEVK